MALWGVPRPYQQVSADLEVWVANYCEAGVNSMDSSSGHMWIMLTLWFPFFFFGGGDIPEGSAFMKDFWNMEKGPGS